MRTVVMFVLLLLAGPVVAQEQNAPAEQLTANDLYAWCTSSDTQLRLTCKFYVLGAVDGLSLGDGTLIRNGQFVPRAPTHFCLEKPIGVERMIEVFVAAVGLLKLKYPDDLKNPAIGIVNTAMTIAYPCPK